LVFDDVFVPEENVIGFEGEGMDGTMLGLAASRGPVGAIATGIARGAYERFVDYAENTKVNGRALINERRVQTVISEMAIKIHLARQAYMDAAMQLDFLALGKLLNHRSLKLMGILPKGLRTSSPWIKMLNSTRFKNYIRTLVNQTVLPEDNTRTLGYASMAKAIGSDVAMEVTTRALEIVEVEDSIHRRWIEKFFRDAKLTQIYEGTNQINRMMYYKTMCSRDFKMEPFKTRPMDRR
jgi:butyryl-CoA dehydrogenase